ncbi:hypothetical protein JTB14_001282 [Gonioctena quinquepunctata]|nr:hypothetical protein JTB14_001282 [Gonioctena quinquepunctata]
MRIPHSINPNTLEEYSPSPETLDLLGEIERKLFSEDFQWNKDHLPSLVDLCVQCIAKHFEQFPLYEELPCEDKDHLLELISVDLPLELVVPMIEDEYYWKRRYETHFRLVLRRKPRNWKWKNLYLERHIQQIIEDAQPQYSDEENMEDILDLCSPYVGRVIVSQLQAWIPPLTMDKEDIPEIYPNDHINFVFILRKLPNVIEVDLVFGMNNVSEKFNWNMFKMTVKDCQTLGKALLDLKSLEILRIHRSKLEFRHCQVLMQNLVKNRSLVELDLSNCEIGDKGALCVAKFIGDHRTLKKLNLSNNNIGKIGAEGLGFTFLLPNCAVLNCLNLRLNPLKTEGAMGIMRAMVRCSIPEELIMSGCEFEEDTPIKVCQMIKLNEHLKKIDISNNWFGESGGECLVQAMEVNTTLEYLDVRETDITTSQQHQLRRFLLRNRFGFLGNQELENTVLENEDSEEKTLTETVYKDHEHK